MNKHLAKAKDYIAIAESGDSKREAYKRAAAEVAAAVSEGMTRVEVATSIGKSDKYVGDLIKWHESGCEADTPWLADKGATGRAALSHTRKVLREADPAQIKRLLTDLPPEQVEAVQSIAADVAWDQSDRAEAADTPLTPAGVAKRREAKQQSNRRAISVLDALVRLDRADGAIFEAVELLAELDLSDDELNKVDRRLQRIEQGTELARRSLTSGADWDAALAELQS